MKQVFADAGYWIALWSPRDALHHRAVLMADTLTATRVVTTRLVLIEALDAMAGMGEFRRRFATQMVRRLEQDPDIEIVSPSDAQFMAALERYAARPDQRWGLTDCASFLVMEARGIAEALAYDRDFEQAGFVALLRDESR
ncbi:MAG: PIN domain-containing protein [Chloroflexi bacterium]|nr:PIN domain-containing protein [Chloroflexota bacterium]